MPAFWAGRHPEFQYGAPAGHEKIQYGEGNERGDHQNDRHQTTRFTSDDKQYHQIAQDKWEPSHKTLESDALFLGEGMALHNLSW